MFTTELFQQTEWNVPLLIGLLIIAGLYTRLVYRPAEKRIQPMQPVSFYFSLVLFFLLMGSPLKAISHLSFSFHMIQMSLLYFVIPPLLLSGVPTDLARRIWQHRMFSNRFSSNISPIMSLAVFSGLFFLYHLPFVLQFLSQHPMIYYSFHVLLLILSFHSWLPIISPVVEQRFAPERKQRFIRLSGMLLMPACLFFVFSAMLDGTANPYTHQLFAQLCLPAASTIQLLPPFFNSSYDQALAGLLMLGIHKFSLVVTTRFTVHGPALSNNDSADNLDSSSLHSAGSGKLVLKSLSFLIHRSLK